jgi:5S rRNA maturation endonuclease (ribonuclease M5)
MNKENKETALKELNEFIRSLNDESLNNSIVVVEGKKDIDALNYIGFKGNLKAYHHFKGTTDFVDHCSSKYKKLILLLDADQKGKVITKKILTQTHGKFIDLNYKKKLLKITKGRIKKIEEMKSFYIAIVER